MTVLPPNPARGVYAVVAFVCMGAGAWMLWGFAASLFIVGLFCAIDAALDEAIERITLTSRGFKPGGSQE